MNFNKKSEEKFLSVILTLAMVIAMVPMFGVEAYAGTVNDVKYIDAEGVEQTCQTATVLEGGSSRVTLADGWYVITTDATINNQVKITGDVKLILCDGCTLNVNYSDEQCMYIQQASSSLTVYGQSAGTGHLIAYGAGSNGIGGNGNLVVNGGIVEGKSTNSPGIGLGAVVVNGGVLCSNQETNNTMAFWGTLTVNGGSVEISGGNYAISSSNSPVIVATSHSVKAGADRASTTTIANDGNNLKDKLKSSTYRYISITPKIEYIDENGVKQYQDEYTLVTSSTNAVTWTAGWYAVQENITIEGGVTVSGAVHLILTDNSSLTISNVAPKNAGINVSGDYNSLSIYGQGTGNGCLTVIGGDCGAGIGGSNTQLGSNITINGGIINATGGGQAAGIGGGSNGSCSNITINRGTVTATGGSDGVAGLGSGAGGESPTNIYVNKVLVIKADNSNPPAIEVAGSRESTTDVEFSLEGKRYVTITPVATVASGSSITYHKTVQEAVNAAASGDTITLLSDVDITESIEIASTTTVSIDLNGHVLKYAGTTTNSVIKNEGNLTIIDNDTSSSHYFTVTEGGLWVLTGSATEFTNLADITATPAVGTTIKVPGGVITGGRGLIDGNACGGGIYNASGAELTISDGAIVGNTAWYGGGIYNKGNLTINGGSISGNEATYGGAIRNDSNSTLTINGGVISGNITESWGGINNKGTLNISGGAIVGNTANCGAGIYNSGTASISDGVISGNITDCGGGGIYNGEGTLNISGGKISDNTATMAGGGIDNEEEGTLNISGGEISGNTATMAGGGIQNTGALNISGGAISGNAAAQAGGGIMNSGVLSISNSAISSNTAGQFGGGILSYAKNITVSGITVVSGNAITGGTTSSNIVLIGAEILFDNLTSLQKSIGVTILSNSYTSVPGKFAACYSPDTYQSVFFSDLSDYIVASTSGGLELQVKPPVYVCQIGTTSYTSIQAAIDALATAGETIQLTTNVALDATIEVSNTTPEFTLDLNGCVINGSTITDPYNASVIVNKGNLVITDSSPESNHYFTYSTKSAWTLNTAASDGISISEIDENTPSGASVRVSGGIITGGRGTFVEGSFYGGGIYNYANQNNVSLTISGASVVGNYSAKNGGGIYNYAYAYDLDSSAHSAVVINNSVIAGNSAGKYGDCNGGGIYNYAYSYFNRRNANAEVIVNNSLIANNFAGGNGGSIHNEASRDPGIAALKIDGSSVNGNYAEFGGGIYNTSKLIVTNSAFSLNTAKSQGGGICNYGGTITMAGCSIAENEANKGGGIYNYSSLTVTGCSVTSNKAVQYGGGICQFIGGNAILSGITTVSGNILSGSTIPSNIYVFNGQTIIIDALNVSESSIGITTQTIPSLAAIRFASCSNPDTYKSMFFGDDSAYEVTTTTEGLQLSVKPQSEPVYYDEPDPTYNVPVSGEQGSVNVSATVSGNTAAVNNITEKQIEKTGTEGNVVMDLTTLSKSVTGVTIPKTTLKNVAESEADGLEIRMPNGTVAVFDSEALAAVAQQAKGSTIKLVVERDTKAEKTMTNAQKETVSEMNKPVVLDAYFTSNGQRISDFNGGEAELTAEYPTEYPVRVWYVTDEGETELVPSTYDGKVAKFTVKHFSHYVIEQLDGSSYKTCPKDETCIYAEYTDADVKAWYHDGVHFCVENKYMTGYGDNIFKPEAALSRGMIVTILWNMEGNPVVNYAMSFTDVEADAWYAEAIRWAQAMGIVDGYDDNLFGPDDNVTREQLAKILYSYADYKKHDVTATADLTEFTDAYLASDWAVPYLKWAKAVKLVSGKGNGILDPTGNATRAEAATMILNLCENVLK